MRPEALSNFHTDSIMRLVRDDDRGAGRRGGEQKWWQCMITALSDESPGMAVVQNS